MPHRPFSFEPPNKKLNIPSISSLEYMGEWKFPYNKIVRGKNLIKISFSTKRDRSDTTWLTFIPTSIFKASENWFFTSVYQN